MNGIFLQTANMIGSAPADVSAVGFLAPILAFLIVGIVLFALLRKSKILGDHVLLDVLVALFVAVIFVSVGKVGSVVVSVIPWFALLFIALFFMLLIGSLIGKSEDLVGKGIGVVFIGLIFIIFIVAAVQVFSGSLWNYLPGPGFGTDANSDVGVLFFLDWFYSPAVIGAFWLIVAAVVMSFVLVRWGS